ncbi:hypothetical protein MXB_744 [Myxobolus squamalis]|nr:hypothetical protein MXB_744 [Myxobolus squamalis]
MRLIQSLTQMISQTSAKKSEHHANENYASSRSALRGRSHKKNNLETLSRKKAALLVPVSRREEVNTNDDSNGIDANENTLKMIIQNKKRSNVRQHKTAKKNRKSLKSNDLAGNKSKPAENKHLPAKTKDELSVMNSTVTTPAADIPDDQSEQIQAPSSLSDEEETPPDSSSSEEITPESVTGEEITPEPASDDQTTNTVSNEAVITSQPPSPPGPVVYPADVTTTTTISTPVQPISAPEAVNTQTSCEGDDCGTRYSLILKQSWDPDFEDTASSKYNILKGNVAQDISYALGSDTVISEVEFVEVPGKTETNSLTKVYFTLTGDLSNFDDLQNLVNKGNANGLLVKPFTLQKC